MISDTTNNTNNTTNTSLNSSSSPLLSLKMKTHSSGPFSSSITEELLKDQIQVMMSQEVSNAYKCRDYLARRMNRQQQKQKQKLFSSDTSSSCDADDDDDDSMMEDMMQDNNNNNMMQENIQNDEQVDAICREKMCEWSFRVCDHFRAGREIVGIAFDYLDRFLDKRNCDRVSFKLAAMTALYMATKLHNPRHLITPQKLADLSRGEFETYHILDMELYILEVLDFRVNPPTSQRFVDAFFLCLPFTDRRTLEAVHRRAIFFSELATYDYGFISKDRALIALACLLNSMEGLDDQHHHQDNQVAYGSFFKAVQCRFGIHNYSKDEVESVRDRLWYIYSMSAQYKEDERMTMLKTQQHQHPESPFGSTPTKKSTLRGEYSSRSCQKMWNSPVSVANAMPQQEPW